MATKTADAIAIGTGITVWTPGAGNRVHATGLSFSVSVAGSVAFTNGAGGAVLFRTPVLVANTPYTIQTADLFQGGADTAVVLTGAAATTVTGTLWGYEETAT